MRTLVIQEHNAEKAGLHWDIRFEDKFWSYTQYERYLKSFVIPKHRFPKDNEKLLVVPVNDHNWSYRNFEGKIPKGYGKGTVKLIHCDEVEVPTFNEKEIIFEFKEETYQIYKASWMQNYLIKKL